MQPCFNASKNISQLALPDQAHWVLTPCCSFFQCCYFNPLSFLKAQKYEVKKKENAENTADQATFVERETINVSEYHCIHPQLLPTELW